MIDYVALETRLQRLEATLEKLVSRENSGTNGTVTSVGLTMPSAVFDVAGSPITGAGTLAVTFDNQNANTHFSGPTSGGAATPAFRALVAADLPAGTGTVTSVGLSASPSSIFDVSGSPVTGSGTLALSMDFQNANTVLAGPSSGASAAPAFRALVAADVPIPSTLVPYGDGSGKLTSEAALAYIEASDELRVGRLRAAEQSTPSTPASGFGLFYFDTSNIPSGIGDDGIVRQMLRYADTTFTPNYAGATTAGTTTYVASGQLGAYIRLENRIDFAIYLNWTNATGTGNAIITGLPFTSRATNPPFAVPPLLYNAITFAAGNGVQMLIRNNTTQIEIYNSPVSNTGVAALTVETGGELLISGTYFL